jgi:hypothetical protein
MRDSENLIGKEVVIDGKNGVVESFWVTENNTVYTKVKHGTVTINYRLYELPENFSLTRKKSFEDD